MKLTPPTPEQKAHISKQVIRTGQLLGMAELVINLLLNDRLVRQHQKQELRSIHRNIQQATGRFNALLTPGSKALAESDVLTPEKVIHILTVLDCMVQLDDASCDNIADTIFNEYEAYRLTTEPGSTPSLRPKLSVDATPTA